MLTRATLLVSRAMTRRPTPHTAASPTMPPVPHPTRRRTDLPWQKPKSTEDDASAAAAVQAIIAHGSYREADRDVEFLARDDMRGVRLQLDYLKAELLLNQHGVAHTIVVFGGIMVMTGGGPGIMEAANRGAHDRGARSIGLNITLPHEQYPNPYVSPELCFSFHYFAIRKLHFLKRARALVVFPGGYGTLDELFEVLNLVQTRKIAPLPVVLVGEAYWRRVLDPEFLVDEGMIDLEDRELFWFAETAEATWQGILRWYEAAGAPLLRHEGEVP
jgi:uncharacterized protein (TIGR00730 family)